MAEKKRGLGRGLDALLDSFTEEETLTNGRLEVSVNDIDTNATQPRKRFQEEPLKELAASIKVHGIVQPLIVVRRGERYLIVAGERRFRAARLAGLTTVPVLVADFDDKQLHEVALIENIQRENLNPMEEASAIRFLMQQHDLTQEEVSERIGKSRPAVANSLRLLQLPELVAERVRSGDLTAGHGRALAGVQDEEQQCRLMEESLRNGYSVRMLENRIRAVAQRKLDKKVKDEPVEPIDNALAYAAKELQERLGTRVTITGNGERGKLTIEYYAQDELSAIYDILMGATDPKQFE